MARDYYYDRETTSVLECVRHVDGDATEQWTQAMRLLREALQPAAVAYFKADMGEMFEYMVPHLPWTEARFIEQLENHEMSFRTFGAHDAFRWHAKQLEALLRRQGIHTPTYLDAFIMIAVSE